MPAVAADRDVLEEMSNFFMEDTDSSRKYMLAEAAGKIVAGVTISEKKRDNTVEMRYRKKKRPLTPKCKTSKRSDVGKYWIRVDLQIFPTASETPPIGIDIDMSPAPYAPGRALGSSSSVRDERRLENLENANLQRVRGCARQRATVHKMVAYLGRVRRVTVRIDARNTSSHVPILTSTALPACPSNNPFLPPTHVVAATVIGPPVGFLGMRMAHASRWHRIFNPSAACKKSEMVVAWVLVGVLTIGGDKAQPDSDGRRCFETLFSWIELYLYYKAPKERPSLPSPTTSNSGNAKFVRYACVAKG
ncbi:hypothetical protein EV421DRAFT_1734479 [Armillaria borealis]|uniref:Uncharacterized protein n=1 Tax=Armillaria borealis TaxID=47425 RepID=A0AA39JN53_9AGAR|nr:hypothetical protein EV421DRAFT_1734479 [Armillaria borealis]